MEAPPKPPAVDLPREGPKYEYNGLDIGQDIDVAYGSDTQGIPKNRRSGVILHPTSLPGPYGTGEIGQEAYRFVDWLASAGMQIWQVPILAHAICFLYVTLVHRQGEGADLLKPQQRLIAFQLHLKAPAQPIGTTYQQH